MSGFRINPNTGVKERLAQHFLEGLSPNQITCTYFLHLDYDAVPCSFSLSSSCKTCLSFIASTPFQCLGIVMHLPTKNVSPDSMIDHIKKVLVHIKPKHTKLIIENSYSPNLFGSTIRELSYIWERLDEEERMKVGFCIDTSHLHLAGFRTDTRIGIIEQFALFNELIGIEHLSLIHLNDISELPFNHHGEHRAIGKGISLSDESMLFISNIIQSLGIPVILERHTQDPKELDLIVAKLELSQSDIMSILNYESSLSYYVLMREICYAFDKDKLKYYENNIMHSQDVLPPYSNSILKTDYEKILLCDAIHGKDKVEIFEDTSKFESLPEITKRFMDRITLSDALAIDDIFTKQKLSARSQAQRYISLDKNKRKKIPLDTMVDNQFFIINETDDIENDSHIQQYLLPKFKIHLIGKNKDYISMYLYKPSTKTQLAQYVCLYVYFTKNMTTEKKILTDFYTASAKGTEYCIKRAANYHGYTIFDGVLRKDMEEVNFDSLKKLLSLFKIKNHSMFLTVF